MFELTTHGLKGRVATDWAIGAQRTVKKKGIKNILCHCHSYYPAKAYVVGTQRNRLSGTISLSMHNQVRFSVSLTQHWDKWLLKDFRIITYHKLWFISSGHHRKYWTKAWTQNSWEASKPRWRHEYDVRGILSNHQSGITRQNTRHSTEWGRKHHRTTFTHKHKANNSRTFKRNYKNMLDVLFIWKCEN